MFKYLLPLGFLWALSGIQASENQYTNPQNSRPNFLFIAVDDLNDYCGFASEEEGNFLQFIYPEPKVRKEVVSRLTPNIDRLAAKSAPFVRSYCASALCGPSRTSLLTGIAPHKSGYYMHREHFRTLPEFKGAVTLPQLLKQDGYFTAGSGKIFHKLRGNAEGPLEDDWSDAKFSWSTWVNSTQGARGKPDKYAPPKGGNMQFGMGTQPKKETGDWMNADFIARVLESGSAEIEMPRENNGPTSITIPDDKPFFLAAGIFRPHLPFYAPTEFFDKFPTDEMTGLNHELLKKIINDLDDLPAGAERFSDYRSGKMRHVIDRGDELDGEEGKIEGWRRMVQAYLASAAFADACVGRILEGLEHSAYNENTVIMLWSDHGYHLGSKFHIAKQAVWETANRTLMIIHDSRLDDESKGQPRRQIVSLNDLYPTVCELAGVDHPEGLVGHSMVPLIRSAEAEATRREFVFTYMQGNHCLRTEDFAFMRYRDGTRELYDMNKDPNQIYNLANDRNYAELVSKLENRLEDWLENPK